MSELNGDKSRFHRERKQKIHRRIRTWELLQASGIVSSQNALSRKPDSVPVRGKDKND